MRTRSSAGGLTLILLGRGGGNGEPRGDQMCNGLAPVRLELEARSRIKLMAELAWKMICGVQASEENTENSPHRWRKDR